MRNRAQHVGRREWRGAAIAYAIVAISVSAAIGQSTLRFVGSQGEEAPSAASTDASTLRIADARIERITVPTKPATSEVSELRVLNITNSTIRHEMGQTVLPQAAAPLSQVTPLPAFGNNQLTNTGSTELRFVGGSNTVATAPTTTVVATPQPASTPTTLRIAPANNQPLVAKPVAKPVAAPIAAPIMAQRPVVAPPQVVKAIEPVPVPVFVENTAPKAAQTTPGPIARPTPRPIESLLAPRVAKPAAEPRIAMVHDPLPSPVAKTPAPELKIAPAAPPLSPRSSDALFTGLPQLKLEAPEPATIAEPEATIEFHSTPDASSHAAVATEARRTHLRPLTELFVESIQPIPKATPAPPAQTIAKAIPKPAVSPAPAPVVVRSQPVAVAPKTVAPVPPSAIASAFDNVKPVELPPVAPRTAPQPVREPVAKSVPTPTRAPQVAVTRPIYQALPVHTPAPKHVERPQPAPQTIVQAPVLKPMPAVAKPVAVKPPVAAQPPVAAKPAFAAPMPVANQAPPRAAPTTSSPSVFAAAPQAPHEEVRVKSMAPASILPVPATNSQEFGQGLAGGPKFPAASEAVVDAANRHVPESYQPTVPTRATYSLATTTAQPAAEPQYRFVMASDANAEPQVEPGPEALSAPADGSMAGNLPMMGAPPCNCDNGPYSGACPYGPGQSGSPTICGVDCGGRGASCNATWRDERPIPWSLFGPGEYVGPARPEHVSTYYLRVNDFLTLTFIESRQKSAERYRIGVGDQLRVEWLPNNTNSDAWLNREITVQPDGSVTLPMVGEANAAGKTITEFQNEVIQLYGKFQRDPQITITPLTTNIGIQDILKAVIGRNTSAGQVQELRVTPEGTIQAAGIGSVYVQGLTLDELRSELEARYEAKFGPGLLISPALTERATNYVFLGGEVRVPGRYTLEGPTTVMQAIAMAGGWNNGGNTRQVVVFRRDENWCLKATKINLRAPLYGKDPCPTNDVWLRDNDLVIVPKERILCATDVIELYFTRGVYAVFPINYVYDFSKNTGITPIP